MMTDLEHKLKTYYENNRDYDPPLEGEAYLRQLMDQHPGPAADRKDDRRRWLLPIAAMLAAAVALGSAWSMLRGNLPHSVTQPGPVPAEPERPTMAAPAEPVPTAPEPPAPDRTEKPVPEKPAPAPTPENAPSDPAEALPAPADPGSLTDAPAQTPEAPEAAPPAEPEIPVNRGEVAAGRSAKPAPAAAFVPETPQPPDPPEKSQINADYQQKDDRETLTFTLLSTGESVEVDVTGWAEQTGQAVSNDGQPAYVGRSVIVDFIFEKNVTYYLSESVDGSVCVDLDVVDPGN